MTNATHEEQAGALVERLFGDILGAITTYGVYIGDHLNLYRALTDGGPATPAELASRAGIAERYAREWMEQQGADGIPVSDVYCGSGGVDNQISPELDLTAATQRIGATVLEPMCAAVE